MTTVKSKLRTRLMLTVAVAAVCGSTVVYGVGRGLLNTYDFSVNVPKPATLALYVKDNAKAVELGKALFWDMQAGSDGIQACASCHFNAGADSRTKNQISPGVARAKVNLDTGRIEGDEDTTFTHGPNYKLNGTEFPFHRKANVRDRLSAVTYNDNDIVSSQGVVSREFVRTFPGVPFDFTSYLKDPQGFQVNGINVRRVEPRNTPTVINAVFNFRNFWDGRAQNDFNGVNPFGSRDPNAKLFQNVNGTLTPTQVSIENSSLASQAVGPPLSFFEMSAKNRVFPDIGVKMLAVRPLARQKVATDDSVLGPLSRGALPGLTKSNYKDMVKDAFKDEWYNSNYYIRATVVDGQITNTEILNPVQGFFSRLAGERTYTQAEYNFSLFWGLAIQMYEATLVSDQTKFDFSELDEIDPRHVPLTESEAKGRDLYFSDAARCVNCHGGQELTDASNTKVQKTALRERRPNILDFGFNNIGVTPTDEDLGVGGNDGIKSVDFPDGRPLSFARLHYIGKYDELYGALPRGVTATQLGRSVFGMDGAFKIPQLRNVELTAPYFHNGGYATLSDVLDFYMRGGDFNTFKLPEGVPPQEVDPNTGAVINNVNCSQAGNAESHPGKCQSAINGVKGYSADRKSLVGIRGLTTFVDPNFDNTGDVPLAERRLTEADKQDLLAFLLSLTDQRVKFEKAPFDHPQLFVPNGHIGNENNVVNLFGNALDAFKEIAATGAGGTTSPQNTFADNLAQ